MSGWRTPSALVLCDGTPLAGVTSVRITANQHFAADSFSFGVALNADPAGLAGWDARISSVFEIRIGIDGGWTSLITGQADTLEIDPVAGLALVEGRDFTARFIGAPSGTTYANQTASDVAAALAAAQGLSADITQTSTPIGRYYSNEHDRVLLDRYTRAGTQWDLLVWLADLEGFDVSVSGTTLYFGPSDPSIVPALTVVAPTPAAPASNAIDLRLNRSFTLAAPVEVTVKSWNSQLQTGFSGIASAPGTGTAAKYLFMRPNLTAGEATALAQRKLAALTRHQYVVRVTLPGELTLTPGSAIAVTGTASSFDQTYWIDEITRILDPERGFIEIIEAKATAT